jgi:hypothetical protein
MSTLTSREIVAHKDDKNTPHWAVSHHLTTVKEESVCRCKDYAEAEVAGLAGYTVEAYSGSPVNCPTSLSRSIQKFKTSPN